MLELLGRMFCFHLLSAAAFFVQELLHLPREGDAQDGEEDDRDAAGLPTVWVLVVPDRVDYQNHEDVRATKLQNEYACLRNKTKSTRTLYTYHCHHCRRRKSGRRDNQEVVERSADRHAEDEAPAERAWGNFVLY